MLSGKALLDLHSSAAAADEPGSERDVHCLHLLLQRIKLEKKVLKRRWGMTRMCCWLHRCAPGACNGYLKSAPVPKNSSHSETAFSSVQFSSRKVEDSNKIRKMTRGPGHGHNQSWWILIYVYTIYTYIYIVTWHKEQPHDYSTSSAQRVAW